MGNKNSGEFNFEIELTSELFEQVNAIMEMRGRMGNFVSDERVPYNPDIKQQIDIVGESRFQDNLCNFKNGNQSEVWENGVLLPEPDNANDKNAILLYLINSDYWIEPVGYIPRDLAAKLNRPLSNLLSQGQVLPVKCKLVGGNDEFPNIGVKAWIKSDAIDLNNLSAGGNGKGNLGFNASNSPSGFVKGIGQGCGITTGGCGCLIFGLFLLLVLGSCA